MTQVNWTIKFDTGIKKIDDQHKKFIGMINSTDECIKLKKHKELSAQITNLLDYARIHFSTEESILEKYSYPYIQEHKLAHLKLLEQAIYFYDKSTAGEDVGKAFILFLKDWLENHLKKQDFKYVKYFKENKIKAE